MKNILTIAAVIALTASANATDLPNKKKAPAPAPAAATVPAAVGTSSSISAAYGLEFDPSSVSSQKSSTYTIAYSRELIPNLSVGASLGTAQASGQGAITQSVEGTASYKIPVFAGVSVKAGGGIGERFTNGSDFPYYTLRTGLDYNINDNLVINSLTYRYRDAFDTTNNFKSHQIGTGVTYALTKTYSVFGTIYRNYDGSFNSVDNGISGGLKINF